MICTCYVHLSIFKGEAETNGSTVVSELVHHDTRSQDKDKCGDSNLIALMQSLPSRRDFSDLQYQRDGTTRRLSPLKRIRFV